MFYVNQKAIFFYKMWKKVAFFSVMLYDGLHKGNIMKTTTTKLMIDRL